ERKAGRPVVNLPGSRNRGVRLPLPTKWRAPESPSLTAPGNPSLVLRLLSRSLSASTFSPVAKADALWLNLCMRVYEVFRSLHPGFHSTRGRGWWIIMNREVGDGI